MKTVLIVAGAGFAAAAAAGRPGLLPAFVIPTHVAWARRE